MTSAAPGNPDVPSDVNIGHSVSTVNPMDITPAGPQPSWAPTIDPQMLAVIEEFGAFEPPKYPESTPFQVRMAVLPTEAVTSLLMKTGLPPAAPTVDIFHKVLPVGPEEGILARMYRPLDAPSGPLPVVVYYHGGGWVIADLDTYEPSAKALAERTGAIVASVAYRQAPEHTFPTAHEDAYAAYKWVTENAGDIGGDPARIATAGESAGGNLAVAVAMMARDRGIRMPNHILSVYPVADGDLESASYSKYAKAKPLNKPFMKWFFDHYTPDWETNEEMLISLIDADLSDLPQTTIINAEIDPLAAEGETLAERMRSAGVDVEHRKYEGVTHEFFGMAAVLEQAVEAQNYAAERLKAGLMNAANVPAERTSGAMGMRPGKNMTISSGLRGPESVIYDATADVYYVSNVNGQPGDRDDNGFISKVRPDGSVEELKWIDGGKRGLQLHAPKGLALAGDMLYVADIDGVHVFNRMTGNHEDFYPTPDAEFLNAVAVDSDGGVYATDSGIRFTSSGAQKQGSSKVYRWDADGNRSTLTDSDDLGRANGIAIAPGKGLVVATYMGNEIKMVDMGGNITSVVELPGGQLDGLQRLSDGSHVVSSWETRSVYRVSPDGQVSTIVEGLNSPADIHVDTKRNRVLVPQLMENKVTVVPLNGR